MKEEKQETNEMKWILTYESLNKTTKWKVLKKKILLTNACVWKLEKIVRMKTLCNKNIIANG